MSPVLPVPGLQGMDGVPEMLIAVICCQDDLELSTTAVDADEVRAVAVDGQRHPRVAKSHKKIPLRDSPMDRRRHLDPCHRSRVCGAGPTPSWTQPRACHTYSIMPRGFGWAAVHAWRDTAGFSRRHGRFGRPHPCDQRRRLFVPSDGMGRPRADPASHQANQRHVRL